jgi:HK97 family phage major capsid protein
MITIQQLREKRNAKAKAARDLLEAHPADKGTWNAEHQSAFDALGGEIEALDQQIKNMQRALDLSADEHFSGANAELEAKRIRDLPENHPSRIFDTWLRQGERAISADQWQVIRNTMSTTTGSEGGYTVQTDVANPLIEALKAFGGMRRVAEVFSTTAGNDMSWPTSDGTSEVGELIAQNTTATAADPTFGTVALSVYKFSSRVVPVPFELLQDSVIDVEAFVRQRLATRLGRITNQYYTTGTGSSQPRGIVTAAGAGKVGTTGQTLTVIYDDLVDLVHALDPAYRELGPSWMMRDSSIQVIRKLKDTAGRPIWTPGYEAGIQKGVPDQLLGYPVETNQDVAAMAANAKSILFGAFREAYKIRDVMDVTLFRFTDSAYAKLGQVGFLAWMRSGGQCVDAGAVKYYQNSAT